MAVAWRTPVENGCCPARAMASFMGEWKAAVILNMGTRHRLFHREVSPGLLMEKKCRKLCSHPKSSYAGRPP